MPICSNPKCKLKVTKEEYSLPYCKSCKRAYTKRRWKEDSEIRVKNKAGTTARRLAASLFVYNFLKTNPCSCGESRPECLDFDHLDRNNKTNSISRMVNEAKSITKIKEEIAKCQVICSNCHRVITAKQFGWYKNIGKHIVPGASSTG